MEEVILGSSLEQRMWLFCCTEFFFRSGGPQCGGIGRGVVSLNTCTCIAFYLSNRTLLESRYGSRT